MKWSIGLKIGSGYVLAVVIFFIIGVNSYLSLNRMIDAVNWQTHTREVKEAADDILNVLLNMETGQRGFIITGLNQYLEPYTHGKTTVETSINKIKNLTKDNPAQQQRIAELIEKTAEKISELDETIKLRKEKGFESASRAVLTDRGKKVMDEIRKIIGDIHAEEDKLLQQRSEQVDRNTILAKNIIIWGMLFITALLSFVGFMISYKISKRLRIISAAATRIMSGDLSSNVPADKQSDEIGALTLAFSQMVESLRRIITDIAEGIVLLSSSTSEILSSTTQVASGTAESATAINETTTTVEEVRQASQLSSEKAKNVSEKSQRVAQVAQSGQKAVVDTVSGIENIRKQMESIAQTIVRLSEQSQSIGGIIASVTDIADQSNLLSVNAAIEASRAGEQGKGFTVVAQEIKLLAEQSKQATTQVRDILNDVQKATSAAVMATEQGSKAVEVCVKQSAQAGEAIKVLAESSAEAAQTATQIVASSQQQVVGMDQIGTAMLNINQAGTQTAASMRQAETAAQNLNELGQKLKGMVEQFKR